MKMKMFLMVCCCTTAAVYGAMSITNGDFEANPTQTNNVADWFDTVTANTSNWWETTWAGPNVSPNGTSVMGLSYMFTTPNWAYQSIGVNNEGYGVILISFDCGSFTDAGGLRNMGVTVSVYQSDGTFVGADNVDIDGAAGVTLIDSASVTSGALAAGEEVRLSVTLNLSEANVSDALFLRFVNFSTGSGEPWVAIDNVTLEVPTVSLPSPADNAPNVLRTADLSWSVINPNISHIDLYFAAESEPNLSAVPAYKKLSMEPSTTTSYDLDTLDFETTYYWRIDAYEPNTLPGGEGYIKYNGPVWSFTTVQAHVTVGAVNPVISTVEAGDPAVLSVTGTAIDTYQWYKIGDPEDIELAESAKYAGVDTDTLTISNVQLSDEGYYYCAVSNALPSSASNRDTGPGRVMTRRLTSYYSLETIEDDVLSDAVDGYEMALKNDLLETNLAGLTDGVDELGGNSLLLDNTVSTDPNFWGQYALIDAGVVNYEDITIAVWVNWNGGGNWQRIFDFGNDTSSYMFLTPSHGSECRFAVLAAGGNEQFAATTALPTGEWVHVTATLQGNTGRLYVNGELRDTNTAMSVNPISINPALNYIGRSQWPNDPYFNGRIDELMIYNYARTTEQIALDYLAVRGEWVCNNEAEALTYDFDGDCRVGLSDFAMFAEDWLASNRIYLP